MVTNPVPNPVEVADNTPNQIVLGEMTMTTNNTDEENKAPEANRDLRESSIVNVEDNLSCIIKRRPKSACEPSSKMAECRRKQIERHVNRMSMINVKKGYD